MTREERGSSDYRWPHPELLCLKMKLSFFCVCVWVLALVVVVVGGVFMCVSFFILSGLHLTV